MDFNPFSHSVYLRFASYKFVLLKISKNQLQFLPVITPLGIVCLFIHLFFFGIYRYCVRYNNNISIRHSETRDINRRRGSMSLFYYYFYTTVINTDIKPENWK